MVRKQVTLAPFAVGSEGTVYMNVAHFQRDVAVMKIIQQAQRLDGRCSSASP